MQWHSGHADRQSSLAIHAGMLTSQACRLEKDIAISTARLTLKLDTRILKVTRVCNAAAGELRLQSFEIVMIAGLQSVIEQGPDCVSCCPAGSRTILA